MNAHTKQLAGQTQAHKLKMREFYYKHARMHEVCVEERFAPVIPYGVLFRALVWSVGFGRPDLGGIFMDGTN